MSKGEKGDIGKYPGLFGFRDWSDVNYGPGEADYITVRGKGDHQNGPLIDPYWLFYQAIGAPPLNGPDSINNLEVKPKRQLEEQIIPDRPGSQWWSQYAQADNGVRSDASMAQPQTRPAPTPSTTGSKGNMEPEATDPFSTMAEALMSLFSGSVPSPWMGGGQTVMGKGEQSPYVQMPTEMDLPERNPFFDATNDERILSQMLQGPGSSMEKNGLTPMEREAQKAATAQANQTMPQPEFTSSIEPTASPDMNPPVPTPNPSFHSQGGPDLRSIGVLLQQMFAPKPMRGVAPPLPGRNPAFTGGI